MQTNNQVKSKYLGWFLAIAMSQLLLLSACGGSSTSSSTPTPTPGLSKNLRGTAAAGAAIIGQVTVKGSLGVAKSALIGANGNYDVDVTGLTAPYRLRAEGTVGGRTYKLHSYAEAADLGGNVNITPFTDLIVANAAQQVAESYFDSNTPADLDPAELAAQEDALQAKLQDVFNALGVDSAINLLNSTFSADHSGLDAALDIVRIEVDPALNVATITNLIDMTTITDSVVDATDNTETLAVTDPGTLNTAVTDTQAIVAIFDALTAAFAGGLPQASAIEGYFSTDFIDEDQPLALFLLDITTDPNLAGLGFNSISVSQLDSSAGTATVTFNVSFDGINDLEPIKWFATRESSGWKLRGDQRIAELYFNFHCNDNGSNGGNAGACGVNTRFEDNDFVNNSTILDAPVASATVSIFTSGANTTPKAVIYLGVPSDSAPGDGQVYNEGRQSYEGDYKGFGSGLGEINPAIFVAGDIIQYDLYTQALDLSSPTAPQIEAGAIAVASYTDTLLFAPSTTPLYPDATPATLAAIASFTLGNDLTIAWTLAAGTRNSEVFVQIGDNMGSRVEVWIDTLGSTTTSTTFASTLLNSSAATDAGLDASATTYNLLVRIYAEDELTAQAHSRDYSATIPGPGAPGGGTTLACNYESGWNVQTDEPQVFNSYTDFEEVVTACGSALPVDSAYFIGTWLDSSMEGDITYVDTFVFSANGTVNYTETENGVEIESISGMWSVSNNLLTITVGSLYVQVLAVTEGGQKLYSEDTSWSVSPDVSTLDGTIEGEIWTGFYVKQ